MDSPTITFRILSMLTHFPKYIKDNLWLLFRQFNLFWWRNAMVLRAYSKLWESRQVVWKITCTHGFLSFIMDRTRIPKLYSFQNIGKGKKKSECYIYTFSRQIKHEVYFWDSFLISKNIKLLKNNISDHLLI